MVYSVIERYWEYMKKEREIEEAKVWDEPVEECCICNNNIIITDDTMPCDNGGRVHQVCVEMGGKA